MTLDIRKFGGYAGLTGIFGSFGVKQLVNLPKPTAPAPIVVHFLTTSPGVAGFVSLAHVVLMGLFAVFGSSLIATVQSPNPLEGRAWAYVSIIGVAGQVMALALSAGLMQMALIATTTSATAYVLPATLYAASNGLALSDLQLVFFSLTIGSLTVSGLRYHTLPTWLGWSGFVMAWLSGIGEVSLIVPQFDFITTMARWAAFSWSILAASSMIFMRSPEHAHGRFRAPRARSLL